MYGHAQPSVRVRVLAATAGSLVVAIGLAGCSSGGSKSAASGAAAGTTLAGAAPP